MPGLSLRNPALRRWMMRLRLPALLLERGTVRAANPGALRLWAASPPDLLGRPLRTLLHAPAAGLGRFGQTGPARLCTMGGRVVPVTLHTALQAGGCELVVVQEESRWQRRHRGQLAHHAGVRARAAAQASDLERQRRHLADRLHDQVQQVLAAAQLEIGQARARLAVEPAAAVSDLGQAQRLVDGALQAAREVGAELCPPLLADLGLVDALQRLVDRLEAATPLRVRCDWGAGDGAPAAMDRMRATALYRVAEQGLQALASGGVEAARLSLQASGGANVLVVESADGRAGDLAAATAGVRDWVEDLQGRLDAAPAGAVAARLVVSMPLVPEAAVPGIAEREAAALLGLFYRLPVGVVEMDAAGRVELMNPAAARLLLPLVRSRSLANLPDALAEHLPALRATLAGAPRPAVLQVAVPGSPAGRVQLSLHPQAGSGWLAVVT